MMAVFIYHTHMSYGQVTCYQHGGDCYLDCAALNIARAPLRDLRHVRLRATQPGRMAEILLAVLDTLAGRVRRESSYR